MNVEVYESREAAVLRVVAEVVARVREAAAGARRPTLGLPTGRTPVDVYEGLVRAHRAGECDLTAVTTFNLDEYRGLDAAHPASFRAAMRRALFDHVPLASDDIRFPPVDGDDATVDAACATYEQAIAGSGGLDLVLLGLGRNGHVAFNEPGSPRESRTRRVTLTATTRADNAAAFAPGEVPPTEAVTMGIATLLDARRVVVMAFGARKACVVQRLLSDPVGAGLPASWLREHPDATLILDPDAATRVPWVAPAAGSAPSP